MVVTMEPPYNKVLGITNDFLYPSNGKRYESLGPSLHWGSTVPVSGPSLQKISFVRVYCTSMVATGQEIVRGN